MKVRSEIDRMKSQQKRFFKLIKFKEALSRMEKAIPDKPLENERIKSTRALGRVLAEDIIAEKELPDHDFAAMDGYAVNTQNIQNASENNPVKLNITGELYPPDHPTKASIGTFEAMYVACGAPIPNGADVVIKVEFIRREKGEIIIRKPVEKHRNIAQSGEDVKKNEIVLSKGHIMRAQDIGLLVALKQEFVNVIRKPKVAIISVGDELTEPFGISSNKTANNNAYIIASLVEYFNAEPILLGIANDNIGHIEQMIKSGLDNADIVITIAGCSVGLKDYVPNVLGGLGKPGIIFHGVSISAGKVSGVAVTQGKPIIMLPGHVGSTVATFYLFVIPLLNMQLGLGFSDLLPKITCILDGKVTAKPTIDLVLPVKVHIQADKYHAVPLKKHLSILNNLVDANGYVFIPAGVEKNKNDIIDVKIFGGLEFFNMMR